jgi:hypothetical protein
MWISRRPLLVPLAVLLTGLVAINVAFAWYGHRHFLPEQKLAAALEQGPGCVVFTGDSRTSALLDTAAVHKALARSGVDACVADLTLGGVGIPGHTALVRRYLAEGGRPRAVVLGFGGAGLLRPLTPPDPGDLAGSGTVSMLWATPADIFATYPDGRSIREWDQRFRFALAASLPMGVYEARLWEAVQQVQDRFTGKPSGPSNEFGAIADMEAAAAQLTDISSDRLGASRPSSGSINWLAEQDPFFVSLSNELEAARVPLVLVQVPMPSSYRQALASSPVMASYRAYVAQAFRFIDLSDGTGLTDADFPDNLHVSRDAASGVSAALGGKLAPLLS